MFSLETFTLEVKTTAGTDILDLTAAVAAEVEQTGVAEGLLTLFISGSTAALSTIEFETGVVNDLRAAIDRLFPRDIPYEHDRRWGDGNGYAHVRAAFLKPSLQHPPRRGTPPVWAPGSRSSCWTLTTGPGSAVSRGRL